MLLITPRRPARPTLFPYTTLFRSSWQAARAGIDFRGDGGYIIAPPSRQFIKSNEIRYLVNTINTGPATSLDADRLRDFLDPAHLVARRAGAWRGRRMCHGWRRGSPPVVRA